TCAVEGRDNNNPMQIPVIHTSVFMCRIICLQHRRLPLQDTRNTRMRHPQWEWCTQRSLALRHPPRNLRNVGLVEPLCNTADIMTDPARKGKTHFDRLPPPKLYQSSCPWKR